MAYLVELGTRAFLESNGCLFRLYHLSLMRTIFLSSEQDWQQVLTLDPANWEAEQMLARLATEEEQVPCFNAPPPPRR